MKAILQVQTQMERKLILKAGVADMILSKGIAIAAILALGISTGLSAQAPAGAGGSKQADANYIIGPSDVLTISVWKDTELSRTIPVRPDGKISLPLIDELTVSGLTTKAVQDIITQKLRTYISDPQVTVIVQEVKSRTYSILGKIAKPADYPLGKPTTALEAIAIAGGFTDFARETKIYIMRPAKNGSVQTIPFNYKKAIKPRSPADNVWLQNGDTIIVP